MMSAVQLQRNSYSGLLLTFNLISPVCFERLKIGQSLSYVNWILVSRLCSNIGSWGTVSTEIFIAETEVSGQIDMMVVYWIVRVYYIKAR